MNKNVLKSKTFWFGIITAVTPLFTNLGPIMAEHSASIGMVWGAAAIVLRMVTKEKVVLID